MQILTLHLLMLDIRSLKYLVPATRPRQPNRSDLVINMLSLPLQYLVLYLLLLDRINRPYHLLTSFVVYQRRPLPLWLSPQQ